jgi:(heptosyl)LPS beta-1,4-glucosyltransferase
MGRELRADSRLSVAIITKNEEERLPSCLQGLGFADEVVVVDSESTDRTVDVARSFGVNVFVQPWMGFSGQKQYAVDRCSNRWVLVLDADERVPAETARKIPEALEGADSSFSAFSLKRRNFLHDKWIKHCGWWPDRVLRVVDRTRGRFDGRAVHEGWTTEGKILHLDACIEHFSFRNYSHLLEKMERYSSLSAEEMYGRGIRTHALEAVSHGIWMFLRTYLLELGLLEGFDGFMISATNAGGSFLKYAKLREKWERHGREPLHR